MGFRQSAPAHASNTFFSYDFSMGEKVLFFSGTQLETRGITMSVNTGHLPIIITKKLVVVGGARELIKF